MSNQIYYLLDFHKKCVRIITYDIHTIEEYCKYVNFQLNRWFSIEEQKQLKMDNFDKDKLHQFAYEDVDNISFDGLNITYLDYLFHLISFVDLDDL
jgi:hypothetical protein